MKTSLSLTLLLALLWGTTMVQAQNTTVTYQGRVQSNGTNFTGTGQFKFALVTSTNTSRQATATATVSGGFVTIYTVLDGGAGYATPPVVTVSGGGGTGATATAHVSGGALTSISVNNVGNNYSSPPLVSVAAPPPTIIYTTYWSHDGTSFAGSEPASAVGLSVNGGLFTGVLGDTTKVNMTALPSATFLQPNLQLRVWFSDGNNGFAALSPVQNLTAAPYAAFANLAGGLVGPVSASQITGSFPSSSLAGAYNSAVTLANPANQFTGGFTGSGAGLTNLGLASVTSGGFLGWGSFAPAGLLTVGSNPRGLAVGDVNADGKLDLISANLESGNFSVWVNNGSGGFLPATTYNVAPNLTGVAAADMNGDGRVDLIAANFDSFTVLTNNRNGGFSLATNVPATGSYNVVAVDVNGDGKVDLIGANWNVGTVFVLTNNGNGGFALSSTTAVGNSPLALVAADLDGDGRVDLVCANLNDHSLSVLTNGGNGSFGLRATLTVGAIPRSVVAADINGDGKIDLICANSGDQTLTVLTNTGSGNFTLPGMVVTLSGSPLGLATGDFNRDGKIDLLCSLDASGNPLLILTNNGSGVFGLNATLSAGASPYSILAPDLNGDGAPDVISTSSSDQTISVLLNVPTFSGNFSGGQINATNLSTGTLPDARLSSNVPRLNASQAFSGPNIFGNANNSFTGNGAGLTGLQAASLVGNVPASALTSVPATSLTGTLADARFSFNVPRLDASQGFSGVNTFNNLNNSFNGNGSGLTALNASHIDSGTLSDGRLSGNIPLLAATQTFTGANYFNGSVGVGTTSPQEALHVAGNVRWGKSLLTSDQGGAIELGDSTLFGSTPHLDFHFGTGNSGEDYNVRLVNSANGQLDLYQSSGFVPLATFNNSGLTVNGTLVSTSDRNAKENFRPVDAREVLEKVAALPITRWNYKQDQPTPHVGPMAQDFHAAFNLGSDDKHISVVDEGGVALAAIQGLNRKLADLSHELEVRNRQLDAENAELKLRLEALEKLVRNQK